MNSVDAMIVLRDMYESEYNIYQHINNPAGNRPLASVSFHPAENINDNSMLVESMRTFINKGIGEKFKISYVEFLELPTDVVAMMISVSDEKIAQTSADIDSLNREFSKLD